MLAAAGLVTLRDDTLTSPTPADIVTDKSKVTVSPVDASQTAIAYQDGTPTVINAEYPAPPDPSADGAIYADDPDDPEAQVYTAVWATTADRAHDEDLKKLIEVCHSGKVRAAIEEDTNGTAVPPISAPRSFRHYWRIRRPRPGSREARGNSRAEGIGYSQPIPSPSPSPSRSRWLA